MKNFYLVIWMLAGMLTMVATLLYLSVKDWQPAIFFLLATMYADWNFHRIYNEIVSEKRG